MVRNHRRHVGETAEQTAFRYLIHAGLRPVARNFRTRRGEIDLVMLDQNCLVFVEVRYRTATSFVDARYTVDRRKQAKLVQAASMFIARRPAFHEHTCRFDVLAIDRRDDGDEIDWLKDAFRPGD